MVTLYNFGLSELQFYVCVGGGPRNYFQFCDQDSTTYHTGNIYHLY